ncbi:methyltransferase [Lentzea sp. NPDC003310]|uniref:class I SAM-dependent methyltransferase n=1 Tax=Lentzea sp. NPDC003310 TaxID=3154447 RepID=UPI0033BE3CC4
MSEHGHGGGHGHNHGHGGHHGHGHGHNHGATHGHGYTDHDQAEVLDLDAELLADHTAAVIDWLPTATARRVTDLGAGTGAGTFALLTRFPEAHVTAVDASVDHLQRLRTKAGERGVADRVHTVLADLDTDVPDIGAPDLIWASASLHHLADPVRTLRGLHDALAPGGLLAVVELSGMPRFLPEQAPDGHDERLPHRGADWAPMLTEAGFTVEGERTVTVHIERSEAVERYARIVLGRQLDPDVLEKTLRREDLALRTERKVWAARKAR